MTQEYFNKIKKYYKIKFTNLNQSHSIMVRMGQDNGTLKKKLIIVGLVLDMLDTLDYDTEITVIDILGVSSTIDVVWNTIEDADMNDILQGLNKLLGTNLYKNFE